MSEQNKRLDGILKVQTQAPVTREMRGQLEQHLTPIAEQLNLKAVVCDPTMDVVVDNGLQIGELTKAIRELVEINQAMLEYIVSGVFAGDESAPTARYLDDDQEGNGLG